MRSKNYGEWYNRNHNHMETRTLLNEMRVAKDIEVCQMIISLGKQVLKENGGHDIRFKTVMNGKEVK